MKTKGFLSAVVPMVLAFAFFGCSMLDDIGSDLSSSSVGISSSSDLSSSSVGASSSSDDPSSSSSISSSSSSIYSGDGSTMEEAKLVEVGSHNSSLGEGGERWFKVLGNGNTMAFTTTGNLDLYMHVYDADGYELRYNDDAGEGFNPRVTNPTASGAVYFIKVSVPYGSNTNGSFTFVVTNAPAQSITLDGSVESSLNADGEKWFKVTSTGNDMFFACETHDFYSYLEVYDADGNMLIDDLEKIILPTTTGTYFIRIKHWGDWGSNEKYGDDFIFTTANIASASVGNYPDISISVGEALWFKVIGTGNNMLFNVTAASEGMDIDMRVIDVSGINLEVVEVDYEGLNPRAEFETEVGVAYYVMIYVYRESDVPSGNFTFTVADD
jgi:hypothetical protein